MWRLGEFEFEPSSGRLSRKGESRRLEPQPAKVLALLASRSGAVVSHEELRIHVWGEETYVDFERGLRYCIGQIRSALGDSARLPRYIETLPKRGYRLLVAAVEMPGAPDGAERIEPEEPQPVPSRRSHRGWAALFLILAAAASWFGLTRFSRSPTAPAPGLTVAVVPFDNETGEADAGAVARGFSDAVVARLVAAEPERLAVIGNAIELRVPRERRDLVELGRVLGARYFVLGQLQRQDGRSRVVVHLIRASDQKHLWADRLEQGDEGAIAFEAKVAERAAAAVRETLLGEASEPASAEKP